MANLTNASVSGMAAKENTTGSSATKNSCEINTAAINSAVNVYTREKKPLHAPIHVEDYAYLVKRIAHHVAARMPASVQLDDLLQSGMVGLLEAAQKFESDKGASFETYAGIRIKGAMIDEMRRGDWAPRSVHRNTRRIAQVINELEAKTGKDAQDRDVAKALGLSLDEYYAMLNDTSATKLYSFEEVFDSEDDSITQLDNSDTPSVVVHKNAFKEALAHAITTLPEREQLVLSLYYEQELNLKEIGLVFFFCFSSSLFLLYTHDF